jgi:uncharacterized membrane protein SpoIIM required for sporulation
MNTASFNNRLILYYATIIATFSSGLLYSYFSNDVEVKIPIDTMLRDNDPTGAFFLTVFYKVFLNNVIVGLLLSLAGYFSGGILTLLILFWNGIALGTTLSLYILDASLLNFFIYHGPIELLGLFLFGTIGLRGWKLYFTMFKQKNFCIEIKFYELVVPTTIILVAALIEAYLICYH